jgi:hypothetical protein
VIQDIFLTYANNSLKEAPENLNKIFEKVGQNIKIDLEGDDQVINLVLKISEHSSPEPLLSMIKGKREVLIGTPTDFYVATNAVTGGRDYYYAQKNFYYAQIEKYKDNPKERTRWENDLTFWQDEKPELHHFDCGLRELNKRLLGEDLCEQSFVLKCYECHQLIFVNLLHEIVAGKEYSEIEEIDAILRDSSVLSTQRTDRFFTQSNEQGPFKQVLTGHTYLTMGFKEYVFYSEHANSWHAFNEYLNSIAYYSLTEFLLHNDRRKLKKCPYCDLFFVAKDIKRQKCYSDDCRKEHERLKKQKQREKDLAKYY